MLWKVHHAHVLFATALILVFIGCLSRPGTLGEDFNYIKDPAAVYNSGSRSHFDSLFRLHREKVDSLYQALLAEGNLSDHIDRDYTKLKYLEQKLNGGQYPFFDSLYISTARDTPGLVPELKLEYLLLGAVRQGIQGKYETSDRLFDSILQEGDRYFSPAYDLMLRIREKHAEMWRYDANNPEKAMKILVQMDSILRGREDFDRFHRNQLYTLATTNRILGKFDEALANALLLREKLMAQQPVDSTYFYSVIHGTGQYLYRHGRSPGNKPV